jgi:hypothetical protein
MTFEVGRGELFGIVRGGGMVASGTVAELRSGSPVSVIIDAPGAPRGWADHLPGVTVLRQDGSRRECRRQMVLAVVRALSPI